MARNEPRWCGGGVWEELKAIGVGLRKTGSVWSCMWDCDRPIFCVLISVIPQPTRDCCHM